MHPAFSVAVIVCLFPYLASGVTAAEDRAKPSPKVEQVVVVFKTHFDIGYTDLARNVVNRYRTSMIDKALEVCDHTKPLPPEHRFVWTLSGWPMTQILWPGQTADRRRLVEEAIRDGRLVWHALPGSLHTESLDLEDLVRGLGFSSELSRQFGAPPARDAKMTDVPSHVWALPTVLKHAGVDFFHIGCNSISASPEVPLLFWWEGPDGSRLLTMYEAGGYGSQLQPPQGWPHKTWLALIHTGDNHGPPAPDEVQALLKKAAKELPGVKIRMGRLSDFADALLAEKPDLPVVRADTPDTWIHGIMSMPQETKIARNLRPEIGALESLNTLLKCWGCDVPSASKTVRDAYEGSLLYGEHTWGASVPLDKRLYGDPWREELRAGKYAHMEESWREHGAYVHNARDLVAPALKANLEALAGSIAVEGPRVVVFNPLPWSRDDVVAIDQVATIPAGLKDAATGEPIAVERTGGMLRLIARQLPPLGYRTYVPASAPAPAEHAATGGTLAADARQLLMENDRFRMKIDSARGVVASLVDKKSGRELIDTDSKYGLGQYLYERFDADTSRQYMETYCKALPGWAAHFCRFDMPPAKEKPYSAVSPTEFTVEMVRSEVSVTARMTSVLKQETLHRVGLDVTLYAGRPFVDLQWRITEKPPETWPETGWLCLPLAVDDPSFCLGRLGAPIDPARDIVPGSNHDMFCLNSGMTVAGPDGQGIALCSPDAPLVSLGAPGAYRYSSRWTPREAVVFLNLFNNVWGTNFQQWISGSWSTRVRLWVSSAGDLKADLLAPSWEARSPARAVVHDGPAGRLPVAQPGLALSRQGVLVTAFGPNPDGDGLLLRLWEQSGRSGVCRVQLPEGIRSAAAQPCDLRGRRQGNPIAIEDGHVDVPLGPFAPASFLLDTAK
ncbi:MAG: hypothetical protein HUU20_16125 [Pirellulales bacterium]|nr:hypothetical protein [Pirellulales bacterium]